MAGQIEVSSTVEQGPRSWRAWCCSGRRRSGCVADAGGGRSRCAQGARLLVVDDFDVSRDALVQCLAQWGVTATAVNNAEAAISALKQGRAEGCPYRAVIVDQSLPGSDGETLGQRIAADAANRGFADKISFTKELSSYLNEVKNEYGSSLKINLLFVVQNLIYMLQIQKMKLTKK